MGLRAKGRTGGKECGRRAYEPETYVTKQNQFLVV
jgi:hypothetical protein